VDGCHEKLTNPDNIEEFQTHLKQKYDVSEDSNSEWSILL